MILVDPARVMLGVCLIATIMFVLGFWFGRRWGYIEGIRSWRRSYRYMTPADIKAHKEVIRQMDAGKSGEGSLNP